MGGWYALTGNGLLLLVMAVEGAACPYCTHDGVFAMLTVHQDVEPKAAIADLLVPWC